MCPPRRSCASASSTSSQALTCHVSSVDGRPRRAPGSTSGRASDSSSKKAVVAVDLGDRAAVGVVGVVSRRRNLLDEQLAVEPCTRGAEAPGRIPTLIWRPASARTRTACGAPLRRRVSVEIRVRPQHHAAVGLGRLRPGSGGGDRRPPRRVRSWVIAHGATRRAVPRLRLRSSCSTTRRPSGSSRMVTAFCRPAAVGGSRHRDRHPRLRTPGIGDVVGHVGDVRHLGGGPQPVARRGEGTSRRVPSSATESSSRARTGSDVPARTGRGSAARTTWEWLQRCTHPAPPGTGSVPSLRLIHRPDGLD